MRACDDLLEAAGHSEAKAAGGEYQQGEVCTQLSAAQNKLLVVFQLYSIRFEIIVHFIKVEAGGEMIYILHILFKFHILHYIWLTFYPCYDAIND